MLELPDQFFFDRERAILIGVTVLDGLAIRSRLVVGLAGVSCSGRFLLLLFTFLLRIRRHVSRVTANDTLTYH